MRPGRGQADTLLRDGPAGSAYCMTTTPSRVTPLSAYDVRCNLQHQFYRNSPTAFGYGTDEDDSGIMSTGLGQNSQPAVGQAAEGLLFKPTVNVPTVSDGVELPRSGRLDRNPRVTRQVEIVSRDEFEQQTRAMSTQLKLLHQMMSDLTEAMKQDAPHQGRMEWERRRGQGCFNCGEFGHFKRNSRTPHNRETVPDRPAGHGKVIKSGTGPKQSSGGGCK